MSKTYRICRVLRMISGKKRPYTTAILLAGGTGSRMGAENGQTKQLLSLAGDPVLIHTARAFDRCPYIDDIVVVARQEELATVGALLRAEGIRKLRIVVPGGNTRQASALCGFEAVNGAKTKFVAIHDVARCLITEGQISDVVAAAYAHRAASAACRIYDTVKRANTDGMVTETLDRECLWLAQTPQVFSADLYRAAAYTAKKDGFAATDDMMLCEHIGQTVKLIDCGQDNFKLTRKEDAVRALAVLEARAEAEKRKGK